MFQYCSQLFFFSVAEVIPVVKVGLWNSHSSLTQQPLTGGFSAFSKNIFQLRGPGTSGTSRLQQHNPDNLLAVICQVGRVSVNLPSCLLCLCGLCSYRPVLCCDWQLDLLAQLSSQAELQVPTRILPVEIPSVYAGWIHTSTLWFGLNLKIPECETF